MCAWNLERERSGLEKALGSPILDFSAVYITVNGLHSFIQTHPENIKPETISALVRVLKDSKHVSQTQSFFLYREASDALASILVHTIDKRLFIRSISSLKNIVDRGEGRQQRAAAEALGSLPLCIRGPQINEVFPEDIPLVKWEEILKLNNISIRDKPAILGRSLAASIDNGRRVLVVKPAFTEDSLKLLNREAGWMNYLHSCGYSFPVRFQIPLPLKIKGSYLFRLKNSQYNYAIAFIAHKDYFTYPNDHRKGRRLAEEKFREVIFRNAWLLGKLTSMGIVHSAPIPLFHNRVQRNRRTDHGIYEWHRGGRLDRWLSSCRYPNFGITGIRDFEHLVTFKGKSRKLYRHIGSHILSLLLVTGSYFRNYKAEKFGFDRQGRPVDVRKFFDESFFKELIQSIFSNYYNGFAGRNFSQDIPFNFDGLTSRMIEEMGVDRHMEEILRAADQREMTEKEFRDFLAKRGSSQREIDSLEKGVKDIIIHTGPHLGGFNGGISLPELIEFLQTASAYCIAGRYWRERFSTPD